MARLADLGVIARRHEGHVGRQAGGLDRRAVADGVERLVQQDVIAHAA